MQIHAAVFTGSQAGLLSIEFHWPDMNAGDHKQFHIELCGELWPGSSGGMKMMDQ